MTKSENTDSGHFDKEGEQDPEFVIFEGWSPSKEYQRMQTSHALAMGAGWLFVVVLVALLLLVVIL